MTNFEFKIPGLNGEGAPTTLSLSSGQHAFVVGPNGSGKSSLMQRLYSENHASAVRLSAHRQTWFTSDSLDLSPQSKRQSEQHIKSRDRQVDARWKDDMAAQRANIAVYELIDAENVRARGIAAAVDGQDMEAAVKLSATEAPLSVINELLRLAGLPIALSIEENERIVARRAGSEPYSIAELSDGERNALLMAAAVLTAPPGSLILVDEPERHLHRSIISPLLTHLFARRGDCAFIVSTHEVLLPIDHPDGTTILVRSCSYAGKNPSGWDLAIVSGDADVPEEMKRDILGARDKILFIEGTEDSLDKPLYGILLPEVTVVPKGSCLDVEHATSGLRSVPGQHWVEAYGLVDGDGRSDEEIASLAQSGICAIPCYSVESLYYDPEVMASIADRVADLDGSDSAGRVQQACEHMVAAMAAHKGRLCARISNRAIRDSVLRRIPDSSAAQGAAPISIEVPIGSLVADEQQRFDEMVDTGNVAGLIRRYPARETPALSRAAAALGFQSRRAYEAAVLRACTEEGTTRTVIEGLLGELPSMVAAGPPEAVESGKGGCLARPPHTT